MSLANPNKEATVEEANGFTAVCVAAIAAKAPSWAEAMDRVNRYVMNDLPYSCAM